MSLIFVRLFTCLLFCQCSLISVSPNITWVIQGTIRPRVVVGSSSSPYSTDSSNPDGTLSLASSSQKKPGLFSAMTSPNTPVKLNYSTKSSPSSSTFKSSYNRKIEPTPTTRPSAINTGSIFTKIPHQMLRHQNPNSQQSEPNLRHQNPNSQQSEPNLSKSKPKFTCDHLLANEPKYMDDILVEVCDKYNQSTEFFCHVEENTCKGNCGRRNTGFSCSCDHVCEIYGSCCPDFRFSCPQEWSEAREKLPSLLDVKTQCLDNSRGYLVIASCPGNSSVSEKQLCEETEDGPFSFKKFHFKNRHCLRCHGFQETGATKWNKTSEINLRQAGPSFPRDVNEDFSLLVRKMGNYHWNFPFPITENKCFTKIVDSCPPLTSALLSTKCKLARDLVTVYESGKLTLYKNKYCAQCNVNSDYSCFAGKLSDVDDTRLPSRFTALVTMASDYENNQTFLRALKPFLWNLAVCTGKVPDLNCKIISCTESLSPVNNSCVKVVHQFCVRISFQISGGFRVFRGCSSRNCSVLGFHYLIVNMMMAFKEFVVVDVKINIGNDTQPNVEITFVKDNEQQPTPSSMGVFKKLHTVLEEGLGKLGLEAWFYFCVAVNDQDACDSSTLCVSGNISLPVNIQFAATPFLASGAAAPPSWIYSQLSTFLVVLFTQRKQ